MTDKAIEAAAKTLAAIAAYENIRWDEATGRYREALDRQRNRPLPPPPGKEG